MAINSKTALILSVLWSTLIVELCGQGQRPHPNHNYSRNGTVIRMQSANQMSVTQTGHWAVNPVPHNIKMDRQQQLYKVSEWGGRPGSSATPNGVQAGEEVPEDLVQPGGPPLAVLPPPQPGRGQGHEHSAPHDHLHDATDTKDDPDSPPGPVGSPRPPRCAENGRYYCSYKEDYPSAMVTQVSKYLKWPLEKLFRDLRTVKMPKLAETVHGALVCDSLTRIIRPGWARNTNGRWLVIINTDRYQQYVTEVVCRYDGAFCNFIPPCYHATCQQRFNTQTLLVVDPMNPYKGPFLAQFLFPSCCVCHVPDSKP